MKELLSKISKLRSENIFYYYIISLFSVYGIWKIYKKFFYTNIEFLTNTGSALNNFLSHLYLGTIELFLDLFSVGYRTFEAISSYGVFPSIALEGPQVGGIYVAYHCLGFAAFFVFIATLFLLPGKFLKKLVYALIGIIVLFTVNTIRIFGVLILNKYASEAVVEINHSYVFLFLVYSTLFILHFSYIKKFVLTNDKT